MRDELLAYLLNDLDDEQRTRIEERLEVDPIWQHELKRLQSYVEATHDQNPTESDSPPADLVSRTCSFVKQASSQGTLSPAALPPTVLPASLSESQDATGARKKRWTLLDLAVVASILAVMGTLLIPAIRESREAARRMQCQENLHSLGMALRQYAQQHNGQLPSIDRHENAGMFAVKLVESGVITEQQITRSLSCPSETRFKQYPQRESTVRVPSRVELNSASAAQLQRLINQMGGSFAYRIGYVDEQGNYRQVEFTSSQFEPMMADKPSYEVVGFQSANHGGCGQNVLFQDGSVRYVRICIRKGTDQHWFLNEDKQHAAGIGKADIVMIRGEASPAGKLLPTTSTLGDRR